MDFFYPNYLHDFWRVMGLIHFGDAKWFESNVRKGFDRERIIAFCTENGLAFFDTATAVRRLKGNASDAFLEVVEPTDVPALLARLPECRRIVTTGGKASEELMGIVGASVRPKIGDCILLQIRERETEWWRMPSTSRAYPLTLEKKAAEYRHLFK